MLWSRFKPGLIQTFVTLLLLALLLSLAFWQFDREQYKRQQIRDHTAGTERAIVSVEGLIVAVDPFINQRVELRGRYHPEHQFLLDNRTHEGIAGYFTLTPFVLVDGGAIMVNRGWVPTGQDRNTLPDLSIQTQTSVVRGRMVHAPRVFLLGEDGYDRPGWPKVVQSVDYPKMSTLIAFDVIPALVRLDQQEVNGYLRAWQPYFGIEPERHRAYAFQWLGLAITLLFLYVFFGFRRRG